MQTTDETAARIAANRAIVKTRHRTLFRIFGLLALAIIVAVVGAIVFPTAIPVTVELLVSILLMVTAHNLISRALTMVSDYFNHRTRELEAEVSTLLTKSHLLRKKAGTEINE